MKKIICTSLALMLALGVSSIAFAAETAPKGPIAASTTTTQTVTDAAITTAAVTKIVSDMTFTGAPVQLSLADAYKKMLADSPGAKMATLNKQSADGVAKGYGESVQRMKHAGQELGYDYDSSNVEMQRTSRIYATAQGPKNYESEINSLKTETLKNYYTLKELENQENIARDNLALKETLLKNTQLKYKLGTVAKNDVLKAEISVNEAKDTCVIADNALKGMKMSFNQFMGYDLMQNVNLTDTIKEIPLSSKTLVDSIKNAFKNRNEISQAAYSLTLAKLGFEEYKNYPKVASKYINAQMAILSAETSVKNTPMLVESDVRTKYMAMYQKYSAVQTGKKSVVNAKENVRLAQLQYDSGLATLSDVELSQLSSYTEQLDYSKALLEYNLAVDAYELSSTVGTEASKL